MKLCQSEERKNPELNGDVGKHLNTHNNCLNTATGTSQRVSERYKNSNLNQLFEKSFTSRLIPKNILTTELQLLRTRIAYTMTKEHITILRESIENTYKIQTF